MGGFGFQGAAVLELRLLDLEFGWLQRSGLGFVIFMVYWAQMKGIRKGSFKGSYKGSIGFRRLQYPLIKEDA